MLMSSIAFPMWRSTWALAIGVVALSQVCLATPPPRAFPRPGPNKDQVLSLSVKLDSTTTVTTVSLDTDERVAYVFGTRPDGSSVSDCVRLNEAEFGALAGGEMAQITFPDGKQSQKLELLYIEPRKASPFLLDRRFLVAVASITLLVLLGAVVYYWRRTHATR
jgi:hypothetical protein